uniref:Serine/arginine-rich SC35-like splicing factor SCL30A n=1 Tax=Zea mays TaxID=4577 RepID=A0A804QVQ9_MAIZE
MTAREPRGFGFIQYFDPEDASDANGRGRSYDGRLRSRSPGLKDSPRGRSRSQSRSYLPALKRKHYSRSPAPRPRERSLSCSLAVNRSRSASPIVSRSPRRQGSLSVSE